jgi:hypothetical protein
MGSQQDLLRMLEHGASNWGAVAASQMMPVLLNASL